MNSKVRANFIYNLIYHIFLIIVPLITTPYVSRRLGATGIGDYAYAYSVANYFALFIKLGLNNYGNRTIAYTRKNKKKLSSEFWNIYFFQFILSIAVVILYLIYSFCIASNSMLSIYLVLFVISSGIDISWFFWGMEEFKITVTRSFIIKILSTISIFIFIKDEGDTGLYTLILSVSYLLSQVFLWPRIFKYVDFVKPTKNEVVKHIKPNFILFLPAIAVSFYKIMDKIMLGMLSTTTEVGFYESSEKIIRVPMAVIESLGAVMQPRMSNLISNNADKHYMSDVLKKSIIVTMACSTVMGFGIMTMSNEFVPMFYGSGFDKCSVLFRILLPSCMFLALTNVMKTQYLLPRKQDKEYTIALFSGAIVNLVLNSLLIPHYSSVGAAVGTLAAEATVATIIGLIAGKTMAVFDYYSMAIPFVIAGLVMFVTANQIHFSGVPNIAGFVLKIGVSGIIYITILGFEMLFSKFILNNEFYDETVATVGFVTKRKKNINKNV